MSAARFAGEPLTQLPAGGDAAEYLGKASAADFDVDWLPLPSVSSRGLFVYDNSSDQATHPAADDARSDLTAPAGEAYDTWSNPSGWWVGTGDPKVITVPSGLYIIDLDLTAAGGTIDTPVIRFVSEQSQDVILDAESATSFHCHRTFFFDDETTVALLYYVDDEVSDLFITQSFKVRKVG